MNRRCRIMSACRSAYFNTESWLWAPRLLLYCLENVDESVEGDTETPARYKPNAASALITEKLWPEKRCVFQQSHWPAASRELALISLRVSLWASEWGRGGSLLLAGVN